MSVKENIAAGLKAARKKAGFNVDEVGAAVGKSGKTISAWEVGRGQPDGDELIALCKFLGVRLKDFYGEEYESDYILPADDSDDGYVDIPIYGEIAAGTPIEMIEVDYTFPCPRVIKNEHPNSGWLKVRGDSYNRDIPNGYLALVDFDMREPNEHDPFAVCVNGYAATIKKVKKLANGFELIPNSYDPTFVPVIYDYNKGDTDEITIIGQVVYATMPFDYEM